MKPLLKRFHKTTRFVPLYAFILFVAIAAPLSYPSFAQAEAPPSSDIFWRKDKDTAHKTKPKPYAIPILIKSDAILKKELRQTASKAYVKHIVDEQTLVLDNGMTIQLAGLYFVYNKNGKGPDAIASYNFLQKEFLGKYVNVYQTRDENKGRKNGFDHDIAHIERIDGIWAQGSIIASGLGRVYITTDNPETAPQLLSIENDARKNIRGFWDNPAWAIKSADDVNMEADVFAIVEGQIYSAQQRDNNIYLNFGEDWRKDFTVQIPAAQRKLFSKLGKNPLDWSYKKVRVRGWVESYNGPMIKILHPQQIEFLNDNVPIEYKIMHDFLKE